MRAFSLAAAAAGFGFALCLCAPATRADDTVKIGWIGHLTGVLSSYGKDMLSAAEMAVEDVNAKGGIRGRKLELVVRDDRGDPAVATTLIRELDASEHVLAVSGSMSADVSRALRGYAEANHLPFVSSSGDASLTAPGTAWTERVKPPASVQGAAMAKFVTTLKPAAKVAILRHDILYFPELMNGAVWYLESSGKGSVVYNKYFPPRQADFEVVAAQLKDANPDYVLFAFNEPGLQNFIRAALAAGFKPEQLFSFTEETAQAQKGLGADVVGTYAATFFDETMRHNFPAVGAISDRFKAAHGYYPGYVVGDAYSSVILITQAAAASVTPDRDGFIKAVRGTEMVDASGQKMRFDENGRNTLNVVYIVQAVHFDETALASFQLKDTIGFGLSEVPDLELSKARK